MHRCTHTSSLACRSALAAMSAAIASVFSFATATCRGVHPVCGGGCRARVAQGVAGRGGVRVVTGL